MPPFEGAPVTDLRLNLANFDTATSGDIHVREIVVERV